MKRINDHPILGPVNKGKEVNITIDGRTVTAFKGETIAAALQANDYRVFRRSLRFNAPRKIFCGIGQCNDCLMIVDGIPNVRTCVTRVKEGMCVNTQIGNGETK